MLLRFRVFIFLITTFSLIVHAAPEAPFRVTPEAKDLALIGDRVGVVASLTPGNIYSNMGYIVSAQTNSGEQLFLINTSNQESERKSAAYVVSPKMPFFYLSQVFKDPKKIEVLFMKSTSDIFRKYYGAGLTEQSLGIDIVYREKASEQLYSNRIGLKYYTTNEDVVKMTFAQMENSFSDKVAREDLFRSDYKASIVEGQFRENKGRFFYFEKKDNLRPSSKGPRRLALWSEDMKRLPKDLLVVHVDQIHSIPAFARELDMKGFELENYHRFISSEGF